MDPLAFHEDIGITRIPQYIRYKIDFANANPYYFKDIGTMIFCGSQGQGKTLSAVNYVYNLFDYYPYMILVTNVTLTDYPFNARYEVDKTGHGHIYDLETDEEIKTGDYRLGEGENDIVDGKYEHVCIEYDGLDCLKYISNCTTGVVYLIDELHLELNSLESKNIDIDIMTEISQQRKQRKKIIGTSQVYMRLAKPLREQIFDVVICRNFLNFIQFNKAINGETAYEESGKLHCEVKKRSFYFHDPIMYGRYDTYAKMKRYNKEWNGHKREVALVVYAVTGG